MARSVFISYRRSDDPHAAGRLRDRLVQDLGDNAVFLDVNSIDLGQHVKEAIQRRIAAADVVIVVIGERFKPARLAQPKDFVRFELLEALRQNKPIIPVVVDRASIPRPDELPAELEELSNINAAPLRSNSDFDGDVRRLLQSIERAGGQPSTHATPRVKYNGLYKGPASRTQGHVTRTFLRFYADMTVLVVAVESEDVRTIMTWFNKDSDLYARGTYELDGNRIEFVTTEVQPSTAGSRSPRPLTVKYRGQILGDTLVVDSEFKNRRSTREFTFTTG